MEYQSEEEQIQAIKDWWKENGRAVIAGLLIGVGAIGGYRYWSSYQKTQAEQASLVYARVIAAAASENSEEAFGPGQQIIDQYPGTSYAALAALTLARLAVEKQDYASAAAQLQWVIDNSDNDGFRQIARLRLARVLATQDKTDEAIAILKQSETGGFKTLVNETRGDILVKSGKLAEAVGEYRKALMDLNMNPQRRKLLEMKINDIVMPEEKKS